MDKRGVAEAVSIFNSETVDILMTPESNDSRFAPTVPFHSIDPFAGKQVLADSDRLAGRNRHTDSGILN